MRQMMPRLKGRITSILDDYLESRKQEPNLNIPSWFFQNNVKIVDTQIPNVQENEQHQPELFSLLTQISSRQAMGSSSPVHLGIFSNDDKFVEAEDASEETGDYEYEIDQGVYSELVDLTNQTVHCGNQSEENCSQYSAIVLKTPVRGCMSYMQSVVEYLAKEIGADLVSFDSEDIVDVALDLSLQNNEDNQKDISLRELPSHFFGHTSTGQYKHVQKTTSAIIDSAKTKRRAAEKAKKLPKKDIPTLVHINDAQGLLTLPQGSQILKSFKTQIQERRNQKEHTLLLITTYEPPTLDVQEKEKSFTSLIESFLELRRHIIMDNEDLFDGSLIIDVTPASNRIILKRDRSCYVLEMNIRNLKRAIRKSLRQKYEHDKLNPGSIWESSIMDQLPLELSESTMPDSVPQRIAEQIAWRAKEGLISKIDDIYGIVLRTLRNREVTIKWAKGQMPKEPEIKDSAFQKRLEEIKKKCKDDEGQLLDCIVNPDTLKVTLDDVVIEHEMKETMKQLLKLFKSKSQRAPHPLLQRMRTTGAILYGPPGTGKTHLVRAIAKDMGINMMAISPATIQSKYVGKTEKTIKSVFSLCSRLAPCILFIDEADSLFSKRSSADKSWERSSINQFLQEMDGLAAKKDNPFIIIATNRPMDLDEAFLRRLPQRIQFKLPSEQHRNKILSIILKDTNLHPEVNIARLAQWTDGFSGSDLESFCVQAALIFSAEETAGQLQQTGLDNLGQPGLTNHHFLRAIERTCKSVSKQSEAEMDEFTNSFSFSGAGISGKRVQEVT